MKNILVSNKAWKELHKLKRTLNLRNTNQVIEHLLDNAITLNSDVMTALLEFQKWNRHKTLNRSIVNLLWFFCEEKYKDLEEKYFNPY